MLYSVASCGKINLARTVCTGLFLWPARNPYNQISRAKSSRILGTPRHRSSKRAGWSKIREFFVMGKNCERCGASSGSIYTRRYADGKHTLCFECRRAHEKETKRLRRKWKKKKGKVAPQIYENRGARCVACGTAKNLTIDHIIPLSRGGDNRSSNLQVLCHSCNSKKGAR